jgi:hypothetical protein
MTNVSASKISPQPAAAEISTAAPVTEVPESAIPAPAAPTKRGPVRRAKPATKRAAKAVEPTLAKAKEKPLAKLAAKELAKSPKAPKAAKAGKVAKPKKAKLVRDSFTMPEAEYELIAAVKKRCIVKGLAIKKSEVLRAAIISFAALSDEAIAAALQALEFIKTGRPAKG